MQKELQMWKDENDQHVKALKAEQRYVSFFRFPSVLVNTFVLLFPPDRLHYTTVKKEEN